MRVYFSTLYLWNTAGVPSILVKYGRRAGSPQTVLYRREFDPYNIGECYNDIGLAGSARRWCMRAVYTILYQRPELIIVHGVYNFLWLWRRVAPRSSTLVFVVHSMELRLGRIRNTKYSGKLVVVMPDLKKCAETTYLSNPVDTDLFGGGHTSNGRGLYRLKPGQSRKAFMVALRLMGFGHVDWKPVPPTPYDRMPELLAKHEYLTSLSMFGRSEKIALMYSTLDLQAMSIGPKVMCYDSVIRDTLPEEQESEKCWRRYARLRTVDV